MELHQRAENHYVDNAEHMQGADGCEVTEDDEKFSKTCTFNDKWWASFSEEGWRSLAHTRMENFRESIWETYNNGKDGSKDGSDDVYKNCYDWEFAINNPTDGKDYSCAEAFKDKASCDQYGEVPGEIEGVAKGVANEACCQCGGGTRTVDDPGMNPDRRRLRDCEKDYDPCDCGGECPVVAMPVARAESGSRDSSDDRKDRLDSGSGSGSGSRDSSDEQGDPNDHRPIRVTWSKFKGWTETHHLSDDEGEIENVIGKIKKICGKVRDMTGGEQKEKITA